MVFLILIWKQTRIFFHISINLGKGGTTKRLCFLFFLFYEKMQMFSTNFYRCFLYKQQHRNVNFHNKEKQRKRGTSKRLGEQKYVFLFLFCFDLFIPPPPPPVLPNKTWVNIFKGVSSLLYSFFHSSITIFFAKNMEKGLFSSPFPTTSPLTHSSLTFFLPLPISPSFSPLSHPLFSSLYLFFLPLYANLIYRKDKRAKRNRRGVSFDAAFQFRKRKKDRKKLFFIFRMLINDRVNKKGLT